MHAVHPLAHPTMEGLLMNCYGTTCLELVEGMSAPKRETDLEGPQISESGSIEVQPNSFSRLVQS